MAFVKLKSTTRSSKPLFMPTKQAAGIWLMLHGHRTPNEDQQRFLDNVIEVYLNSNDPYAPPEYIEYRKSTDDREKNQLSLLSNPRLPYAD